MRNTLAALFFLAPVSAFAQQCGPAENVTATLSQKYGEAVVSQGTTQNAIIQVWANSITGTWTIVAVLPNGGICLLASGENYAELSPPPNV